MPAMTTGRPATGAAWLATAEQITHFTRGEATRRLCFSPALRSSFMQVNRLLRMLVEIKQQSFFSYQPVERSRSEDAFWVRHQPGTRLTGDGGRSDR
jgi:hypothetical protein